MPTSKVTAKASKIQKLKSKPDRPKADKPAPKGLGRFFSKLTKVSGQSSTKASSKALKKVRSLMKLASNADDDNIKVKDVKAKADTQTNAKVQHWVHVHVDSEAWKPRDVFLVSDVDLNKVVVERFPEADDDSTDESEAASQPTDSTDPEWLDLFERLSIETHEDDVVDDAEPMEVDDDALFGEVDANIDVIMASQSPVIGSEPAFDSSMDVDMAYFPPPGLMVEHQQSDVMVRWLAPREANDTGNVLPSVGVRTPPDTPSLSPVLYQSALNDIALPDARSTLCGALKELTLRFRHKVERKVQKLRPTSATVGRSTKVAPQYRASPYNIETKGSTTVLLDRVSKDSETVICEENEEKPAKNAVDHKELAEWFSAGSPTPSPARGELVYLSSSPTKGRADGLQPVGKGLSAALYCRRHKLPLKSRLLGLVKRTST